MEAVTSRRIALLIGVSQYGAGYEPLPGSLKDVEEMGRVLAHPEMGGFEVQPLLLNPDRFSMETAIESFFKNSTKNDTLLLYFSGHGAKDQSGKYFYFGTPTTCKDDRGQLVESSALPASRVHHFMSRDKCKSRRVVIVLDCCSSGAFDPEWASKGEGDSFARELQAEGRVVLASCSPIEASYQAKGDAATAPQSLYTQYFLEGIETGAADQDEDGWVSAEELHQYTTRKVQTLRSDMNPQLMMVNKEGFNLRIARAPKGDPKLTYAKEVERWMKQGKVSRIGREALTDTRTEIGISDAEADEIEETAFAPHRIRQEKLKKYRRILLEAIEDEGYPLSSYTSEELQDYRQRILGFEPEDVTTIEAEIIAQLDRSTLEQGQGRIIGSSSAQISPFVPTVSKSAPGKARIIGSPPVPLPITETLDKNVTLEMLPIPGGKFLMGSLKTEAERIDSKGPQHEVTIAPFYMSKYPITQAQWKTVAALPKVNRDLEPDPSFFKGAKRPVEKVSWWDAIEFCDRLSQKTGRPYRLPSEAEWEYACRAGTTTPFYFGETISTDQANYDGNYVCGAGKKGVYREKTTDVGSFPANAFELYDMHGNVWEWCADPWHENYEGAPIDGSLWELKSDKDNDLRLVRGGSWLNDPRGCRSAIRNRVLREYRDYLLGFRAALLPPSIL
jgi:formylglycine-generating enzyme required for sulfatase activity